MPIETIGFNGKEYPLFQSQGNASQFAIPFAKHLCKGHGLDIGFNRQEWKLPGAYGIEPAINPKYDAMNLPDCEFNSDGWDYIFSSHVAEHLNDWVGCLNYWKTKLRDGGVLFLYLPDYSQEYWRPWNNRKHVNILTPQIMSDYFKGTKWKKSFVSGTDLNHSFYAVAEK